jgi:hypothetical protein
VAGYTYFTLKLWDDPEEAVHFLEYGLLGFFLFKALIHHVRDKSIYLTATLLALFIGIIDEILQWLMPQRFWDFRDAALNGLSGALFQLAVWKVIKPEVISEKMNSRSLRILSSAFISCLLIIGLCASNTPQRVISYTNKIPWLSFLQEEEPMSEFGYKHIDPEIGAFYSRLSLKKLIAMDEIRGNQIAQILNESIDEGYEKFIREYNPGNHPFLHELRVHIFRRDTYFNKAKSVSDINEKKELYFVAFKENLILDKYFTNSTKSSIYYWNRETLQEMEKLIDKKKSYESPVSANLFTSFSEQTMWGAILAVVSILILLNFILPYTKILE